MAQKKKVNIYIPLKKALEDILAWERGERDDLRVTVYPEPPARMSPREIRRVRKSLRASQTMFATLLNVSPQAVQSWEQGVRRPRNAALKLLALAKKNPRLLLTA